MTANNIGIVPRALRKGDTIALVSPSGRYNDVFPNMLARSRAYLQKLGYHTKVISNSPFPQTHREMILHRCTELQQAFSDPDVAAILCTAGGAYASELLPHLDYELIKANPKIFCGFSDITVLHYGIFTQTGLHTFYGPVAIFEFGEFSDTAEVLDFTAKHFQQVLGESAGKPVGPLPRSASWSSKMPPQGSAGNDDAREPWPRKLAPSPPWKWLRPGKATGRIFGGCLPLMQQAKGTKYWPDHHGRILMIETPLGRENPYDPYSMEQVRTSMTDLVNIGVIGQISGLVVGRPHAFDEAATEEFLQIILDQCYGTDFPILVNVDVGHTDPMLTIPLNALASLDSEKSEFAVLEPAVTAI